MNESIYNNAGMPSEQKAAPEMRRFHEQCTMDFDTGRVDMNIIIAADGEFVLYDDHIERIAALTLERDTLKAEIAQWKTWCIIEIAVRNPSVAEYMDHWEGRATKAEAKVERLSAPVSDAEWSEFVGVVPIDVDDTVHMIDEMAERKEVDELIAARASTPPTTNPITDDGPDECEGCDKPLRDDEGHETDDMVMLCDECWQGCADDPDCHSEECPCEACAAKIGTMKHPINDDEQRRKDAGWNDRPKARCVCGEMIAWYSGEWLHVAGRSKSCADGRLASPAHFLVGMPPA